MLAPERCHLTQRCHTTQEPRAQSRTKPRPRASREQMAMPRASSVLMSLPLPLHRYRRRNASAGPEAQAGRAVRKGGAVLAESCQLLLVPTGWRTVWRVVASLAAVGPGTRKSSPQSRLLDRLINPSNSASARRGRQLRSKPHVPGGDMGPAWNHLRFRRNTILWLNPTPCSRPPNATNLRCQCSSLIECSHVSSRTH